jgi:hypothetical protein
MQFGSIDLSDKKSSTIFPRGGALHSRHMKRTEILIFFKAGEVAYAIWIVRARNFATPSFISILDYFGEQNVLLLTISGDTHIEVLSRT